MALTFPASPIDGDVYTDIDTGRSFKYVSSLSAWEPKGGDSAPVFVGSKPTSPQQGQIYYDPVADLLEVYNESTALWESVSAAVNVAKPQVLGTVYGYQDPDTSGNSYHGYESGLVSQYNQENAITPFGSYNTAVGQNSFDSATGGNNVAVGYFSLLVATGNDNVAVGYSSLSNLSSGGSNIGIGYEAGTNISAGSNNTLIGKVPGTINLNSNIIIAAGADVGIQINENNAYGIPTATTGTIVDYGTAGYVLTSQGSTAPPQWAAAAGGVSLADSQISEGSPTTRSDGSTLVAGDLYFEGDQEGYFYTGSTWGNIAPTVRVQTSPPSGHFRISGVAAKTGDLYIDKAAGSLYYSDGLSYQLLPTGGGTTYQSTITNEGSPGTRLDGSAFQIGDLVWDTTNLGVSGEAWDLTVITSTGPDIYTPVIQYVSSGAGAPSGIVKPSGYSNLENDLYINETTGNLYRFDSGTTSWIQIANAPAPLPSAPAAGATYNEPNVNVWLHTDNVTGPQTINMTVAGGTVVNGDQFVIETDGNTATNNVTVTLANYSFMDGTNSKTLNANYQRLSARFSDVTNTFYFKID